MSYNDGGSAFPSPGVVIGGGHQGAYGGMSLRDYFAAKAMQGFLHPGHLDPLAHYGMTPAQAEERITERAYALADAMLAEREKAGGK